MVDTSTDMVKSQLERLLTSSEFMASKVLSKFLRYVVEQTLDGQANTIKQYTIAVEALEYGTDFDPQTNPNVRIHARKLRRALDRYYNGQGIEDPIRIDIPNGSYVPVFLPNHKTSQDAESASEPICSSPAMVEPQVVKPNGPSIAILSFEYLGNDSDRAYLANGITEEIVIALTRFSDLLVIGPLDKDIIRQKRLGPRAIGREYKVRFLLDGTARLRGQTLRLTSKLTDTLNGNQLWGLAHDYDIETVSIDQVENEIVGQIVASIADNYGVIPRTLNQEKLSIHDESISDYEAFLKFYEVIRAPTPVALDEGIAALERTIERHPNHDLAIALLSDLVGGPYWLGFVDDTSGLERAETLARRALALNPNLQEAHFAMAEVHYLRLRQAPCLFEIERVLELNPNNARVLANSALFLMGLGQHERSLAIIQKAMRLNPHHPGWYHFIPFSYHYYQGDYESALFAANGFNTPEFFWDPLIRTAVLGQLGHQTEAKKAVGELLAIVPDFESRRRSLIQRMVYREEHAEMLLDGLYKAGMKEFDT